jgi:hypothetical protein
LPGSKTVTELNHQSGISDDICSDLFNLDYATLYAAMDLKGYKLGICAE